MNSNIITYVSMNTEYISKKFSEEFKFTHNLTHHQISLLWVLRDQDAIIMSEVAAKLRISKQQMTKLAENAVSKGLVERSYNPKNKRQIYLCISAYAEELFDAVVKDFKDNFENEIEKLQETDKKRLLEAMDTIIELIPSLDLSVKHHEEV